MNEREFAELIERCVSGQATKREIELVEEWLARRSAEDPFSQLSITEKDEMRARSFENISSKLKAEPPPKAKLAARALALYGSVAAGILLSILTYVFLDLSTPSMVEEIAIVRSVSTTNGVKKVILGDSSIVWLKGNSTIFYPEKFNGGERNIKLTGEALFEVAKDPENPFVIQCGGLSAKVLGTSFNIKSDETAIEIIVLTGKVALSSKGNNDGLIVLPNEKAVYNRTKDQISKIVVNETEKVATTGGTEYSMRFNATRLKEIIRRIEGKFDVTVLLADERLNNCTITADFTDQSLDRTFSMISQTLKIEYAFDGNKVTLEGKGCD
jgi:transmembrane sensor